MKSFRNAILIWALALGFSAITFAQTPNSITIVPAAATTDDSIKAIVCGTWGSSCPRVDYFYYLSGNTLFIQGTLTDVPGMICLTVLTSWSITVPIGKLPAGAYTVAVNIEGGFWRVVEADTFTVTQSGVTCWLADTNNDGIVNQADILPIGLYWGRTGPSCPNCSMSWVPRCCPPWTPIGATCADTNCDGVINQADVLLIGLNWGKTHTNSQSLGLHSQDQ